MSTDQTHGVLGPGECNHCGRPFERDRKWKRYCSQKCQAAAQKAPVPTRNCKACGKPFLRSGHGDGNRWHCSPECSKVSARKSRAAFRALRPEREPVYRAAQRAKQRRDTPLERLWRRWPWLPRACEACGESRVLDIAHRPEHARKGAWSVKSNCTPEKIWILCPTCHALLDRLRYNAEQLGMRPRPPAPEPAPPPEPTKPASPHEAAKKGWATRRAKAASQQPGLEFTRAAS